MWHLLLPSKEEEKFRVRVSQLVLSTSLHVTFLLLFKVQVKPKDTERREYLNNIFGAAIFLTPTADNIQQKISKAINKQVTGNRTGQDEDEDEVRSQLLAAGGPFGGGPEEGQQRQRPSTSR